MIYQKLMCIEQLIKMIYKSSPYSPEKLCMRAATDEIEQNPHGGTPLSYPPIEIHANSLMFALIFWPHVTIFSIFWLHECLKWRLEFNSKSLFDANLGKFSRYERLNSATTNFSWYTCLLTNSDHDIIPMAYHPCMFVLKFFLNRFVVLRL